mgnify:CR=1 FL=1
MAGTTLAEVLDVSAKLQQERVFTALDHLGENVTSLDEAAHSAASYLEALDAIAARKLPATVSITTKNTLVRGKTPNVVGLIEGVPAAAGPHTPTAAEMHEQLHPGGE